MPEFTNEEVHELYEKYRQRLNQQFEVHLEKSPKVVYSREYQQFKQESLPAHFTIYEQLCNMSERILRISTGQKTVEELQESINIIHLNITPQGAISFSLLLPLVIMFLGALFSLMVFGSTFFAMFFVFVGIAIILPVQNIPHFLANTWRMKASNQMVLSIFYVVTYMRHTSNLENAIEFASDHLAPPLALDMKKVLWDIETERYDSIKESLDAYLDTWRKWNMEFIESFHLIESSLYEGSEDRRLTLLDKSLEVMLDETFEKMLHYAQNLKSPITMLHMLGIIMPILGLVILPLVVAFLEGVKWYHLAVLYNIILPFSIFYIGKVILSKRPTGYGETDISEENPELKRYKKISIKLGSQEVLLSPLALSLIVFSVLFLLGILPLLLHAIAPGFDIGFGSPEESSTCGREFCLQAYRESKLAADTGESVMIGPYGLGASILSLFIPLSIGLAIGMYYLLSTSALVRIRERSKQLEQEFASALFQLGNRLGDGLPAEIAFEKVAENMKGSVSGSFFELASGNVKRLGMSVHDAIFNPRSGALVSFPSNLIESSMKVFSVSIRKGPKIAAQALVNVSRYIKEIHKVNERLKDLMADIISSMKSQISFLTPAISGIVIGITSMITTILSKLGELLPRIAQGGDNPGGVTGLIDLFGDGIPTYYFQVVVGIYVLQIVYILTVLTNGIENGADKLNEKYMVGRNMMNSTLIYVVISLIVMILFNMVAQSIMSRSLTA
ncbi:hypothetical protein HYV81_00905 [Candidatus Woesearchaeota archaeon]|nr:hypothetical protein [Candidatus Woesearchaeota archaeon]